LLVVTEIADRLSPKDLDAARLREASRQGHQRFDHRCITAVPNTGMRVS
jgi:hypothetical protein